MDIGKTPELFSDATECVPTWCTQQPADPGSNAARLLFDVLYVDNNEDDQLFVKAACRRVGSPFAFRCADTAKEATRILEAAQNGDGSLPDLILLEVRLPSDEGFDMLKYVRSQPLLNPIPLVVYTDALDPKVLERARKLGADLILKKEPNFEIGKKLLKAVKEMCFRAP